MTTHEGPHAFEPTQPTCLVEAEALGKAQARALIGDDVVRGLDQVRRFRAICDVVYAEHNRLQAEHLRVHADSPADVHIAAYHAWPGMDEAEAAADEAGEDFHHALYHVLSLPLRSTADAIAKGRLAMENTNYCDDEDYQADALCQIVDFLASREPQQAAQ